MRTARLWIYVNGSPVRIALWDGEAVTHRTRAHNGEGVTFTETTVERDGKVIIYSFYSRARDCDGVHGYESKSHCALADLSAGYSENGVTYPRWTRGKARVSDAYAEAMGY